MAQFKPYFLTQLQLNSLPISAGQFIFVTDSHNIYIDVDDTNRKLVNKDLIEDISVNGNVLSYTKANGLGEMLSIEIPVDDALNEESERAIQNKAVATEMKNKISFSNVEAISNLELEEIFK